MSSRQNVYSRKYDREMEDVNKPNDPDDIYISSKGVWQILSVFLILMLIIITCFYAYTLGTFVDPREYPFPRGPYGVLAGQKSPNVLKVCGENQNQECVFENVTLLEATRLCDANDSCLSFYYDGNNAVFTTPTDLGTINVGGTFIRQINS